jgi:hypothetical protein
MPMYRTALGIIHMRGTKLPPPCAATLWIAGKEQRCAAISAYLCDYPDGGFHTCDKALCQAHAREVGKNRHYCPPHFNDHQQTSPQGGLFTGLLS